MEKALVFFALALSGICCLGTMKPAPVRNTDNPTLMILVDAARSVTLQSTESGGVWVISSGNPGAYLATVAHRVFGRSNIGNFQDITIAFDSTFSKGTLTGTGFDADGNKVPVGVEYNLRSQSAGTNTYQSTTAHACTGAPCSCCDFIKNADGTIKGCKCTFDHDECQWHEGSKNVCNHSLSSQ